VLNGKLKAPRTQLLPLQLKEKRQGRFREKERQRNKCESVRMCEQGTREGRGRPSSLPLSEATSFGELCAKESTERNVGLAKMAFSLGQQFCCDTLDTVPHAIFNPELLVETRTTLLSTILSDMQGQEISVYK